MRGRFPSLPAVSPRTIVRAVPRPLALLLPLVLVCTTIWTFWDPAWQVPDEIAHFGYAESLAEYGTKPDRAGTITIPNPDTGEPELIDPLVVSSNTIGSIEASNAPAVMVDPFTRPPWAESAERRYNRVEPTLRRDNGGEQSGATSYPPLYYALESLPYRAASSGTAIDRLTWMRWFSGLWVLVTAAGGWLLAGEVFGRRRLPQLVAAGTLGLWPMITFISAAVNPDAMLTATCTLALWQMARIARRGTRLWPAIALFATVLVAAAAKVSGAALFPAALFAVVAGLPAVRARTDDRLKPLLGLAAVLIVVPLVLLLIGEAAGVLPAQLANAVAERPNLHRFASYLWQFYLPNPGFMDRQIFMYPVISDLPVYNLWLGTSWGTFGWVNIWFPRWVYRIFFVITLVILAGLALLAVRAFRNRRATTVRTGSPALPITFVLAAGAVLGGVHLQDYANGISGALPFAQGRYLFPVASLGALAVAGALTALPRRLQPTFAGAWLGFLVVFQVTSLALLATKFYA